MSGRTRTASQALRWSPVIEVIGIVVLAFAALGVGWLITTALFGGDDDDEH